MHFPKLQKLRPSKRPSNSCNTSTTTTSNPNSEAQTAPQTTQQQQQRNKSSTNLSTTSTLINDHAKRPAAPGRLSSHEAFLNETRMDEDSYEAFIAQARGEARRDEERRRDRAGKGQHWPADPWRWGFGPRTGDGRTEGRDVGDWLRGCGL